MIAVITSQVMRLDDLALLHVPGSIALHDDLLLVDVARPDLEADAYRGSLWRVPQDGPPVPFTHGDLDTAPRVSPDGAWVAFLRAKEGGRPQLHVMPAHGGEPRPITDLRSAPAHRSGPPTPAGSRSSRGPRRRAATAPKRAWTPPPRRRAASPA